MKFLRRLFRSRRYIMVIIYRWPSLEAKLKHMEQDEDYKAIKNALRELKELF